MEGSTENRFLLAAALESSKGPMNELETFLYIFYFYLFERKPSPKFKRKTTKSVNKIVKENKKTVTSLY